jgi:hypothetical protein
VTSWTEANNYGKEPDDHEDLLPPTVPEKPVRGERYMRRLAFGWTVFGWWNPSCEACCELGPAERKACPACRGTGDGPPEPDALARELTEEDARLLAFGRQAVAALAAAPIPRLGETLDEFRGRYSKWYREARHPAMRAFPGVDPFVG